MHYLTLVAIAKDETRNLREWLVYHTLLGVEAFIIYDNESSTPIRETLAPYLHNGFLTVVDTPGQNMQYPSYNHALREFGPTTRWMGFIDLDEFIVPQATDDLRHLLTDYEAHAALAMNWVTYGSGGHNKRPHGLVIENYTQRLPLNDPMNFHIKSIVKPACTREVLSPHHFAYAPGCSAVNPDRLPIAAFFSPPCIDTVRVNHYYYRSQEEFEEKIRRGRADTNAPELRRSIETFNRQFEAEQQEDLSAHKYLEKLKTLLKSGSAAETMALSRRNIAQDPPGYLSAFVDMTRQGDAGKADLILREALTRFPDDPALITVRASSLRLTGDIDRARAELHRALTIQTTPQALGELAALHAVLGDNELAAKLREFQDFVAEMGALGA